jgi:hypothetical protein
MWDNRGSKARWTQPKKVAGTLRRAVRTWTFAGILGGRQMECATTLTFVGCDQILKLTSRLKR